MTNEPLLSINLHNIGQMAYNGTGTMDYDVELLLDQTLGFQKEDKLRTCRLDAEAVEIAELATKKLQENGEDPALQISILLPSFPEPIVLRNKVSITIGRADRQRNAVPTLDLSGENALALGVSRLHAKILYLDSRFHLKDMGSTNGTWLNQIRLDAYQMVPLEHGDEIRLGQLRLSIL